MMHLALVFAAALVACVRAASVRHPRLLADIDEPNSLPKLNRKFITLTLRPPPIVLHKPGSVLELTCEGIGTPAPSIRWFRNNAPVYEHDLESNEIIDTNPSSLARVTSTLLVPRVSTGQEDYTCVISTGQKAVRAMTTVVNEDVSTEQEERTKLTPLKPRILVYYKVIVDTIGNNVVLPCKAKGHPRPHVWWTDNKGNTIADDDTRMKVLRSGELVIPSLRWTDLGEFTCHASNAFGVHEITTFVYPAKAG